MSRVVGYSTNDIYVEINGDLHNNKTNNISTSTDQKRPSIDTTAQLQYSNDDRENHYNGRSSTNSTAKKKLLQASIICAVFMIVEIIAGIFANSLALVTDASHLFSDLSSFLISLFALWVSDLPGTHKLSFGYHRAEILGALISVMLIWVLTLFLVVEAIHRLTKPQLVNGQIMFITAFLGTVANVFMTYILGFHSHGIGQTHDHEHGCHNHNHENHHDHTPHNIHDNSNFSQPGNFDSPRSTTLDASDIHNDFSTDGDDTIVYSLNDARHVSFAADLAEPLVMIDDHGRKNVNLRAAYIHALGDLIQNIGVLIAASLIWYNPAWSIADPICTFLFSILVLLTTISILKEATNVLMEGTPREIDLTKLRSTLAQIDRVSEIHDLHVWSLSVGKPSLACHIVVDSEEEARRVLRKATYICQREFGILHTTIQIDFSANKLACDTDAHSKCH